MAKVPPHNDDAERSCIGAVLLVNEAFDRCELRPDDFYDPRNREIWGAMTALHDAQKPIDPVTLEVALGDKLGPVGGLPYVSELMSTVPTADNVEFYAAHVRECAIARRTIVVLSEVIGKGFARELTGTELAEAALHELDQVAQRVPDGATPMPEALRQAMKDLETAAARKAEGLPAFWGVPTGFADLDGILGGWPIGALSVLAARPSMGKSSLIRQSADAVTARGEGAHSFTLEDTKRMLALRELSDHARVPLERIRALDLQRGDMLDINRAAREIMTRGRWLVDDTAGVTAQQIRMRIRRHKRRNQTRIAFVDYATLVVPPEATQKQSPEAGLRQVVQTLAATARQENIALVLVSQLNRDCEDRNDKRPLLSDLRGTGALEEAADVVLFVYRDEVYDDESEKKGIAEVIVAKNKHGQTGTVELAFDGRTTSFRDISRRA